MGERRFRPGDKVQVEPPGFFKYEEGRVLRVREHCAEQGIRLIEVRLDNGSKYLYPPELLYRQTDE